MRSADFAGWACLVLLLLSAGTAVGQGKMPCTISLANGDQLQADLVRIHEGKAFFRPVVAPEAGMQLPIENVESVRYAAPSTGARSEGHTDTLRLLDGSVFRGTFRRLGEEWIQFDFEDSGSIRVPRRALDELSRGANGASTSVDAPGHNVLTTHCGDVLVGDVRQEEDGTFVVEGGAVEAKLAYASIAAVRFSQAPVTDEPKPGSEPKEVFLCTLTTRRGSTLVGTDPELADGRFALTIKGGQRVTLSVETVHQAGFSVTGGAVLRRRILTWGTYCERSDEYHKALAIVKAQLGDRWKITEDFSQMDATFQRELQRAGVLLIPEMEQGTPSQELAAKFKPLAESFLRRGGKIVILGPTTHHIQFMRTAGLVDVMAPSTRDNVSVSFTSEGRRVFKDVGAAFTTTNSTYFYVINKGIKAVPLAGDRTGAPIVGRRVGRGWVIVMGMDYHSHNDQTVKVLINALTRR